MATYVVSDIHGCFDEFQRMLDEIHFSERDKLYLAGDYVDRGTQNVEMLRWLEERPENVTPLKGNHDVEFVGNVEMIQRIDGQGQLHTDRHSKQDAAVLYATVRYWLKQYGEAAAQYFDYYGGIRQMIAAGACLDDLERWAAVIGRMDYVTRVRCNGKWFIIVHAGYIQDFSAVFNQFKSKESFYIYAREEGIRYGGCKHATVVAGHTPTIIKGQFSYNNGKVFRFYDEDKDCTFYDIDCGCVFRSRYANARLACLRLDDEEVFYV